MADNDIDMCDDLELVSFIAKEVEYYCTLVNDCNTCSCRYDAADNIYKCRKEHLLKRKEELEKENELH